MRVLKSIFILSIGHLLMDCNQKTNSEALEVKTEHVIITEEVDDVLPPPPKFISHFKTLQEWLFNICDTEKPKKPISNYEFGLFEAKDDYTLYLVGLNRYEISQDSSATRVDFEPKNMYFFLPISVYKNLARGQILERLTSQLKDFTMTDKFKNSFLAKAKSVTTGFKGEIWHNK